jgi:hypothetical protein
MKQLFTITLILIAILITIGCNKINKQPTNGYNLITRARMSDSGKDAAWWLVFNYNKPIAPYKATLKADGKNYELKIESVMYEDGKETFDIEPKVSGKQPSSDDDYLYNYDEYSKARAKYDELATAISDSLNNALVKSKTIIIEIKGKTGNATYTLKPEDIVKIKKAKEWCDLFD